MRPSPDHNAQKVYLDYTQSGLDRAYDQSLWAPNMSDLIESWGKRGHHFRTTDFSYSEHAYGPSVDERLDLFDAAGPVVHFHIHGGAWRGQSKEGCSFMAPLMHDLGLPFVVPEFGKLPALRMPLVLDQIARALIWTYERFVLKGQARQIMISGHSSGAHMAALLASHDFGDVLPISAIKGVLCISGAYDLQPVMLSARRTYISLTGKEQRQLSPIERIALTAHPIHLLYGANESPEFIRQSRAYAKALVAAGKLAACQEIAATNHFEIADQLGSANTPAGSVLASLLTGNGWSGQVTETNVNQDGERI